MLANRIAIPVKNNRLLKVGLKTGLFLLTYGYLYYALKARETVFSDLLTTHAGLESPGFLIAVLLLMPLNWSIEALKWRGLLKRVAPVSFAEALKGVFAGLPYALVTPQRLGEIPGRALQLPRQKRVAGGALTALGSFAQHTTTLLLGFVGLTLILSQIPGIAATFRYVFLAVALLLIPLCLWLLMNFGRVVYKAGHWGVLTRSVRGDLQDVQVPGKIYSQTLALSAARYLVFISQYALLLHIFGVNIAFLHALPVIAAIYLTMTVFPSFLLTDLGVRGSVAVFFLQHFSANLAGIVAASAVLWLINLVVPALLGSFFMWQARFLKS